MAEESEEMLVKNWVSSPIGVEENSLKVTIPKKPGNGSCKDGKGEQKKEGSNKNGSYKERPNMKTSSQSSPIYNGNNKVNCPKNGRGSGKVKAKDTKVNSGPRMAVAAA